LLVEKDHVHPPNDNGLAASERLGLVDQITPDDVSTWVVIMRLDCPRAFAPLAFQAVERLGS
jgi:hypothetical protein